MILSKYIDVIFMKISFSGFQLIHCLSGLHGSKLIYFSLVTLLFVF